MNLIDVLKRNSVVRAILARLRRSRRGRDAIRRAVSVLDRDYGAKLEKRSRITGFSDAAGEVRLQEFDLRRIEFRDNGPTLELLALAASLPDNPLAWQLLPIKTWSVLAAAQLEAGDRGGAERTVRAYAAQLGLDGLDFSLPVAAFARELGLRSPEIDRAALVASTLAAGRERDVFRTLVTGKSIAVVGNGPGNIGSGEGAAIDAHDIVIRFNNFPDGYQADYGARTDIWVRGAHQDVRDRAAIEEFALVLWEMDFPRNLVEHPSHTEILFRDSLFAPEKVAYIDTETKAELRRSSGLTLPTSGAQVLWMLHQARGSLEGVDVYGFSSLDGSRDYGHYFDKLGDMSDRHDIDRESAFLRRLLGRDRPVPSEDQVVVFNCAYRDYDPARGRTGGPAGVLATQRLALGDEHHGAALEYIFDKGDKGALKRSLPNLGAGLTGKPIDLVLGAEYIRSHPAVLRALGEGKRTLMVCHDLGSAFGAYLLGVPYVIVYHQQGSTLREMVSIGRSPSAHEIAAVTRMEETICGNAQRMYFPSIGARDAFIATADPALAGKVDFADVALYNTLSAVDHETSAGEVTDALRRQFRLPVKNDDTDVFMSVGDWNGDKGLDRVPALLDAYAKRSGRKVLWIAIGSASDRSRFQAAQREQKTWGFESRLIGERVTHDKLLALLGYADYYVMLHRNSIFDLATLEAMRAGKGVILSPVGGNPEVNLADNVVFATDDTIDQAADSIRQRDLAEWGGANRRVFDENFSLAHFAERYRAMLDEQLALVRGARGRDERAE